MQAHLGAAGVAMIFSRTGFARLVRLAPCGPVRDRRPDAHDGSAETMTVQSLAGDDRAELSQAFVAGSDGMTVHDGFSANEAHASIAAVASPGRAVG
jgi:hypothetical protein